LNFSDYSSQNLPPSQEVKIPINITLDGEEKTGYLEAVDYKDPCCTFLVWVEGKWFGTLQYCAGPGWLCSNKKYPHLAEELGNIVMLWYE
jgi:hypothetical protein